MPIVIGEGLSFCGRALTPEELALIRQITGEYANLALTELAATVCEPYAQLPKWRKNARRPSCLDLIALLPQEMQQQPEFFAPLGFRITNQALVNAAAA